MADTPVPLTIGDALPAIALEDCHGEEVFFHGDRLAGNPLILALCERAGGSVAQPLAEALSAAAEGLRAHLVSAHLVAPEGWDALARILPDTRRNFRLLHDPARLLKVQTRVAAEAFLLVVAPNGRIAWGHALNAATVGPRVAEAVALAKSLVTRGPVEPAARHPPVLTLENVIEPALCEALIAHFAKPVTVWPKRNLASEGFAHEMGDFKIRESEPHARLTEHVLREESLVRPLAQRFSVRVIPEIAKAFQVAISRQEPFRIVHYHSADRGFVSPHRDNPTPEASHRRFTISVLLNTGAFEGGALRFPEYGPQGYIMPRGGGVVWSAGLLHEVTPVTAGERFMLGAHLY